MKRLWLLAVLCACSAAQVTLPDDGPRTVADLRALLHPPKVKTLQGTARLDAYVAGDRKSVTVLVIASTPQSLQIQALTPTLDLVALLSTDGQRFTTFERGGSQCLVGQACPRNLARLLPLPLSANGLVRALLGDVPLQEVPPDQQRLAWDSERKLYRLELGDPSGWQQHVFVAPKTLALVGAVWWLKGARQASLQYEGEVTPGGSPKLLRIKTMAQNADMTLEMRDVQIDQPVAAEVFAVTCPQGMVQVELPCEGE